MTDASSLLDHRPVLVPGSACAPEPSIADIVRAHYARTVGEAHGPAVADTYLARVAEVHAAAAPKAEGGAEARDGAQHDPMDAFAHVVGSMADGMKRTLDEVEDRGARMAGSAGELLGGLLGALEGRPRGRRG